MFGSLHFQFNQVFDSWLFPFMSFNPLTSVNDLAWRIGHGALKHSLIHKYSNILLFPDALVLPRMFDCFSFS